MKMQFQVSSKWWHIEVIELVWDFLLQAEIGPDNNGTIKLDKFVE